jgi:hypothetical protein
MRREVPPILLAANASVEKVFPMDDKQSQDE